MRADEFSKMRSLENVHWWFGGRRYLVRGLIRRLGLRNPVILDAGCGTGFARRELAEAGTVIGLDACEAAFTPQADSHQVGGCIALIERAPFAHDTFDLVVAMDVLEHLEDDGPALREIHRVCRPNGYLFVTVPAYEWLWSRHDDALGHRRRYSAAELAAKVREAGFAVCSSSYLVTAVFPCAAAYRILRRRSVQEPVTSDLFPVPRPLNFILKLVMRIECWLAWRMNLPFGLTAFVLARKIEQHSDVLPSEPAGGSC